MRDPHFTTLFCMGSRRFSISAGKSTLPERTERACWRCMHVSRALEGAFITLPPPAKTPRREQEDWARGSVDAEPGAGAQPETRASCQHTVQWLEVTSGSGVFRAAARLVCAAKVPIDPRRTIVKAER
jgi:hypothetical protein